MAYTTINKSTDYFNTKLYTGTGTSGSPFSLTGVGFAPDWTWIKRRDGASIGHRLFDRVRGATKYIDSSASSAETTNTSTLTAFGSDGFTLQNEGSVNDGSALFTSWNWKANGQGSANTDGSINTTYTSVSTTAGFSISQYTGNTTNGATVGHGLGAVPEMLIGKDLSDTSGWGVWHKDLTNAGYRLNLSTTDAQADDTALFGGSSRTAPTSSVFTLGSGGGLNGSNANIMYAFTSIKGYSKINSYTGNGSTDGTFVYTGFKPAFVMVKESSSTGSWCIFDNKRLGYNPNNPRLYPNNAGAEDASETIFDIVSNGFKIRGDQSDTNASGQTYIYMCFAEAPLVGSNNVPCTAR